MGDKYRKTSPQRQPEKQRLKLCGQGSGPTLAIILCNPGRIPTLLLCTLTWAPHDCQVSQRTHLRSLYPQQHQLLTHQASGSPSVRSWVWVQGHTGQGHQEVTRDLSPTSKTRLSACREERENSGCLTQTFN